RRAHGGQRAAYGDGRDGRRPHGAPRGRARLFRQRRRPVNAELVNAPAVAAGLETALRRVLVGPPGLGKTLLVRTLADLLALDFRRIAFTPDLMPADIIGTQVIGARGGFEFLP